MANLATTNLITISTANTWSDGDPTKWPNRAGLYPQDNRPNYLREVARYYRQTFNDLYASSYVLDGLPIGYRVYGRTRSNNPNHVDCYFYGHPSGRPYRSAREFSVHFKHLFERGNAPGCECVLCRRRDNVAQPAPQTIQNPAAPNPGPGSHFQTQPPSQYPGHSTQPQGPYYSTQIQDQGFYPPPPGPNSYYQAASPLNQSHSSSPLADMQAADSVDGHLDEHYASGKVDKDGAEDIVTNYAIRMQNGEQLDEKITEERSIDWLLEHEVAGVDNYIRSMRLQKMWQPRGGEVVLFVRHVEAKHSLRYNDADHTFRLWDSAARSYVGFPKWEAGLVTQQPGEPISVKDLLDEQEKVSNVVTSGYRVEPVPKVGEAEKPWSKRYTHAPLRHMRPLMYFVQVLRGIESEDWHPTIHHALTTMSSFCPVQRYHVKSHKPRDGKFTMYHKAIYIGPELVITDDVVRVTPESQDEPTISDIMKIKSVKQVVIVGTPTEPEKSSFHISGKMLTQDATRAFGMGKVPIQPDHLPAKCSERYGSWFWLHDPSTDVELPFSRIVGRCYEPEGLLNMFPGARLNVAERTTAFAKPYDAADRGGVVHADLAYGLDSCQKGRRYSRLNDGRILTGLGKSWYWANYRIEQLQLSMVRGHDVGDAARYGDDPNTERRNASHVESAFRARKAREKGSKGAYRTNPVFPSSKLAAAGLNQVDLLPKDEHESPTAAEADEAPRWGISRSRSFEEFKSIGDRHRKTPGDGQSFPTKDDVDYLMERFPVPADDGERGGGGGGGGSASDGEAPGAVPAGEDPVEAFFD